MSKTPRKPVAIDLDTSKGSSPGANEPDQRRAPRAQMDLEHVTWVEENFDFSAPGSSLDPNEDIIEPKSWSWGSILIWALGFIVSLGLGLAIEGLIRDLFDRYEWLGWAAAGATGLVIFALSALILKEVWALSRLSTISRLRQKAAKVDENSRPETVQPLLRQIEGLYSSRQDYAQARAKFSEQKNQIMDGSDLLEHFEHIYFAQADEKAKKLIISSAHRVSVVTAISPRAIVDIVYVLMENLRLIRKLSHLYGGRTGTLGFWRLTKNVVAHLAVTGAVSMGDGLVQQVIGHGVASRLSTKLGEGIVNGLLTARIGIAAMDLCRPLPFRRLQRPGIGEFFTQLTQ